jgi:hypothetical protein
VGIFGIFNHFLWFLTISISGCAHTQFDSTIQWENQKQPYQNCQSNCQL